MIAKTFVITEKRRKAPIAPADIKDFGLGESRELEAETILDNPHITLYSLDLENGLAVFVETPPDVNLSLAPFYFLAQYENALSVLTIPFETMIQLAQSVSLDDERLILIHSVGRAGSTLASQIFAQVEGIINISEPDALTLLVGARYFQPDNKEGLSALLNAAVRMLCKTPAQTAWVIKGRSFVIELGEWLQQLYPRAKNIFLYRDAETWLQSSLRAYNDGVERTDEERRMVESEDREVLKLGTPLIAQYDPNTHLSTTGLLSLMWLSVMERYVQLQSMGCKMLAIRYANWRFAPHETAAAMLDYCTCKPADMTRIDEVLTRDSQAGTFMSQEVIQQKEKVMGAGDLEELNRHLQDHAFITSADFEVANTLKL
ncbi:MAG: hypothetical protein ABIQ77_05550 [Anaerolineales bacterium]